MGHDHMVEIFKNGKINEKKDNIEDKNYFFPNMGPQIVLGITKTEFIKLLGYFHKKKGKLWLFSRTN